MTTSGRRRSKVELAVTEHNSVFSNPGKQTTSLVNGLFYADAIGNLLKTEFNAMLWWDLRNGQEAGNNNSSSLYGWRRYGDYGIVNAADPAGPADRYPTFYVNKLLKYFARGGEKVVQASSDYRSLGVYAVKGNEQLAAHPGHQQASVRGAEYHHLHPGAEEGRDGETVQLRNRAGRSGAFRRWVRRYPAIDSHAFGIDADVLTRAVFRPRDPDQQA